MNESVSSQADLSMIEAINKLPTVSVTFRAVSDGTLKVINYSDGFCRMMHCTPQEAWDFYSGSPAFRESFFQEHRPLLERYRAHRSDTDPVAFTCRIPLIQGGSMWVSVQFYSFTSQGERYVYVVFSDIDALKHHELELQEQYQSAQDLMDSVSGTYMAARRCNLTRNTVENISGVETLAAMGQARDYDQSIRTLLTYIPEEQDRRACAEYYSRQALTEAYAAGSTLVSRDYQLAAEDGSVKWVRSTIHLTRRPGSGDLVAFSTVQDVNSEIMGGKLASQIIARNYASVSYCDLRSGRLYIRSGTDGSFAAGSYDAALERAVEQADPAQAGEVRERLSLPAIQEALKDRSAGTVYTFYFSRQETREDLPGNPRRQMKNDVFYLDERRSILVFLLSDVTEIFEQDRESRERIQGALVAAKQASAAKSNFLSRMSHEIRTPLNAIIGMDTIAAQSLANPERVADCVAKIGLSARYLLSLINDILDMSRIESGKMLLKSSRFLFPEFLAGVNNIIYPQVRAKGIDYECTVSNEVADAYMGDETKLQQILVNVLGNAVKFTAKGKISLDIRVLSREARQEKLRFVVGDTGCGIAEENLSRIFDAFEQVDTSTTTVFGGTGLGLAITKNLTGLMGGGISVRSIPGVGSEFTVDIPLTVDETAVCAPKLLPNLQNLHTLIVDDDLLICEQTEGILRSIGMVGEWVTSGQEAVDRVRAKCDLGRYYDFILIDWKMPDMDGIETTQRIRRIMGPDVTIIIISAYDWQSIEAEARAAGANLMISKPLLKSTLVSAFERALGEEKSAEVRRPEFDFTGKRILVAEDNDLNAEIAKTLLESKHFTVELAPNGIKALERFARSPQNYYDAILMDVRMPMMDGLQATVNIRHWDRPDARTVPIVAMTANAFDEDVEKSRAAGMNAHLSKPINPELLFGTLFRLLEKEP
jgi:signal transduction histidine kinase/DNA-binding response OmpR family regulator